METQNPLSFRPTSPMELFCTLPTNILDMAKMDDKIITICEDGAYVVYPDASFEKISDLNIREG
jgi:hypothetical protein